MTRKLFQILLLAISMITVVGAASGLIGAAFRLALAEADRFRDAAIVWAQGWKIGGVFLTGIGALLVGVILMVVYRFINPPFFKGETLNKDTPVLVEETD